LKDTPEWPADKIDGTVKAGKTAVCADGESIAVYLLYWTAFANANGLIASQDPIPGTPCSRVGLRTFGRNRWLRDDGTGADE
jgi:hypothetical protein